MEDIMQIIAGIDIGGTKCAISFAGYGGSKLDILYKTSMPTRCGDYNAGIAEFISIIKGKIMQEPDWKLCSIGISCGGPLDSGKGLILAPPNLPLWDRVDILTPLKQAFAVPVILQNDADACALAEWKLGAGRGTGNMIFLTFGTGMGAGLILNGQLYSGTTCMAGEVGHIRLEDDGPNGYGKNGSFEGFCSGGGIADLGKGKAREAIKAGTPPLFCTEENQLEQITAKSIAEALEAGDPLAAEIFRTVGKYLGRGIAILIDILNPEIIVIGSIYGRQKKYLDKFMREEITREALAASSAACRIVPAGLGELIGDYAALSVGMKAYTDLYTQGVHSIFSIPADEKAGSIG